MALRERIMAAGAETVALYAGAFEAHRPHEALHRRDIDRGNSDIRPSSVEAGGGDNNLSEQDRFGRRRRLA